MDRQLNELSIGDLFGDAPTVAIGAGVSRRIDHEFGIGDLYDLACHLALDERKARRLLDSTLHVQGGGAVGTVVSWAEQRTLLLRHYLKHRRFLAGHLDRVMGRVYSHSKALSTTKPSLEVGLRELRPEERVCLILRERLRLSVAEIAEITGFQCERVSIALFEARERLRKSLPDEGDSWQQ